MNPTCLIGKHHWQPLQGTGALKLSPEQCGGCGKTRIWNARDEQWMYGSAEGLPEELVAFLAGEESLGTAPADTDLPVARQLQYSSGGGSFILAGIIVAAMSLPLWFAAPGSIPKLALGLPLLLVGYALAAGRRDVRVEPERRRIVHRVRLLPLTLWRRTYPASRLKTIRVAWEPNAPTYGPRWGRKPHFLVRARGNDANLRIAACYEPKPARGIAHNIARAMELPVDDKTREPGAPGT